MPAHAVSPDPNRTAGHSKCSKCGYSLAGLPAPGLCPECGTGFTSQVAARAPNALPDPQWTDGPTECVSCGYSLEGLAVPGKCPECGAPFDAQVMVLHGVARSSTGTPPGRRLAWIGLIILAVLFSQGWPFLLMYSWIWVLIVFACLIGGFVAMFITGRRERSGTERFMFTRAGVARLPLKRDDRGPGMDAIFVPYSPAANLRIDTVSPFWRRIRIFMPNEKNVQRVVFDAGFRCPSDSLDRVAATIRAAMCGQTHPAAPDSNPTLPPPLPTQALSSPPTLPGQMPPAGT